MSLINLILCVSHIPLHHDTYQNEYDALVSETQYNNLLCATCSPGCKDEKDDLKTRIATLSQEHQAALVELQQNSLKQEKHYQAAIANHEAEIGQMKAYLERSKQQVTRVEQEKVILKAELEKLQQQSTAKSMSHAAQTVTEVTIRLRFEHQNGQDDVSLI